MRLKLKYGTHTHDIAEASVVINRRNTFAQSNKRTGYIESWSIDGFLQADDQAGIGADIQTLKEAYSTDNKTAVLLFEDGTETKHKLDTNDSISGVRVQLFDFPEGDGAEYSTFRSYRILIDAEFATDAGILWLHESLMFTGGKHKFLHKQTLTGFAQKQIVAQNIPHRVVQSGFVIGHFFWPAAQPPLFPQNLKNEDSSVKRAGPEKIYANRQKSTHFRTEWNYVFESISAMNGNPSF